MNEQENRSFWQRWHIDGPLFIALMVLLILGLFTLYSADGQDLAKVEGQALKVGFALGIMLVLAHIAPHSYRRWSLPLACSFCSALSFLAIPQKAQHVGLI